MEHKSLVKNSVYSVIYKIFNVLFPLISASYLARVLSVIGVGKVAAAQNIAQYFVVIAALGMGNYGTRAIAKALTYRDKSKTFSELFLINAISTTICLVVYYAMVFLGQFFEAERTLYLVVGLNIFLNYFNVDWFYQGTEDYRYIMIRSISVKFISLICLLVFVRDDSDYVIYALINCLATAGNYIFNVINLRKYTKLTFEKLRIGVHFKSIFILLASSIAIELYTMVDTTMLNILKTELDVGYYTNAVKIIRMISGCIIAIGAVVLPRLSYYYQSKQYDEFKKTCQSITKILLLFSVPAFLGVVLLADDIVLVLFGADFFNSVQTIRILSVLIMIFAIAGGFSAQAIIARNKDKFYLYSVLSGAFVNVILNSFLIPKMSYNGAAIASVCAEIVVMSVQVYFIRDVLRNLYSKKEFVHMLVCNGAMVASVLVVRILIENTFFEVIMAVVAGIIMYFGIGLLVHNEQICTVRDKMIEKFKR